MENIKAAIRFFNEILAEQGVSRASFATLADVEFSGAKGIVAIRRRTDGVVLNVFVRNGSVDGMA